MMALICIKSALTALNGGKNGSTEYASGRVPAFCDVRDLVVIRGTADLMRRVDFGRARLFRWCGQHVHFRGAAVALNIAKLPELVRKD
jgi:hypothetical protein